MRQQGKHPDELAEIGIVTEACRVPIGADACPLSRGDLGAARWRTGSPGTRAGRRAGARL
jgi:hypothetical protein